MGMERISASANLVFTCLSFLFSPCYRVPQLHNILLSAFTHVLCLRIDVISFETNLRWHPLVSLKLLSHLLTWHDRLLYTCQKR